MGASDIVVLWSNGELVRRIEDQDVLDRGRGAWRELEHPGVRGELE